MASGFFSILDDVATLLDDVAVASKVATRKTAGILGDDLAVNAEKATGFAASRELPVLWAISKGSLLNKLIIVPVALVLTAFSPVAIKIILVLGAFYLAYEAAEKIIEFVEHRLAKRPAQKHIDPKTTETEKGKIKAAIATDFILSVEIAIIALGAVLEETLIIQVITVSVVALLATVGVYGLVALVIRMDDFGYNLIRRSNNSGLTARLGNILVGALPIVIKIVSVIGTIALLLVSGGIFLHNISFVHQVFEHLPTTAAELTVGLLVGLVTVMITKAIQKIFRRPSSGRK